ncbi:zinc finger protein 142-like [Acipenser ruthenus]|uniref:zinc finger protein 142-like n=1 Tax=Acipenser ruthenus TaxID=7906 RepID=UPI002741B6A4|nr:zinc finger protein 142-like [Acipenser ruthenus]
MESVHPNPAPIRWVVSENREVRIKEEPVPCCDPPRESVPVPQYGLVYMQQQYSRPQTEQNHTTQDQTYVQQGPSASVPSTYAEGNQGFQHPVIKEETSETECTPRPDPPQPGILRVSRFDLERGSTRFKFLRQTPSLRAVVRDTEQRPVHIKVEVYEPGGDVKEEEEERQCDSVNQEEEACALEPGQIKVEDPEPDSVPETRRSVRIGEEAPEKAVVSSVDSGQPALSSMDSGQPAALLGIVSGLSVNNITVKGQKLVCNLYDGQTSVHSMDTVPPRQCSSHSNQAVSPLEMSYNRGEETVLTDKLDDVHGDAVVSGLGSVLNQYRAPGLHAVSLQKNAPNYVSQLASARVKKEAPQEESVRIEMEVPQAAVVQKEVHTNDEHQLDSTNTNKDVPLVESVYTDQEKVPEPKYMPPNKLNDVRSDNSLPRVESVHHTVSAPEAVPEGSDDVSAMDTDPAEKEEEGGEKEGSQISDDPPEPRSARSDVKTPDPHGADETEMESDLENDDPGPDSVVIDKKVHETGSLHPNEKTSEDIKVPDPKTFGTNAPENQDAKILEKREKAAGREDDPQLQSLLQPTTNRPQLQSVHHHSNNNKKKTLPPAKTDRVGDEDTDTPLEEGGTEMESVPGDEHGDEPGTVRTSLRNSAKGSADAKTEEMAAEPATADVKCVIAESHACPHCPTAFPASQDLDKHMKKLHGEERAEKRRTRPVSSRRTSSRSRQTSQSQAQNPEPADAGTDKNLGKHSCADCGERFPTPKTLKKHRDTHQEGQCHPCKKCSKTFRDLELLKRHRLVHRETEAASKDVGLLILEASRWRRKHRCAECGKHFLYAANLKKHRLQQHKGKPLPYPCGECGRCFTDPSHLKMHQKIHSNETPVAFCCPDCGKVFKTAKHLKRHRLVHSEDAPPFQCSECGKRFWDSGHLRRHQRVHTGEMPYPCDGCGKRFRFSGALRKHQRIHTGAMPFQCADCGKRFRESSTLKKHELIHSGETPFLCPDCGKMFNQVGNLKKHQQIHASSAPYQCPECQRCFKRAENLKRHRLLHVGETLHPCPECNTSFRSAARLRKHQGQQHSEGQQQERRLRKHQGQQHSEGQGQRQQQQERRLHKHQGQQHSEGQQQERRLRKHQREQHSGGQGQQRRLRVCEDCGKSFKRAGDYHKHCRIHTGEKPFPCTECQKRFNHLGNLKKHLLVHSGETPFECPDCGKKFSQKGNMKKHRRTHGDDNAGKKKKKKKKEKK